MNFLDAVRALNEGRCEGIKRPNHINYVTLNYETLEYANGLFKPFTSECLAEDWELVNEVKQYEVVEVERWLYVNSNGKENVSKQKPMLPPDCTIIGKLNCIIKREIKPKKKVLTEVGSTANRGSFVKSGIPAGTRLYAYLDEEP